MTERRTRALTAKPAENSLRSGIAEQTTVITALHCLSSIHLDNIPGDRSADCGGIMEPISIYVRPDGEWALIHRCKKCGELKINRIAADDNEYLLLSLACKPLANPPFPLSALSSNFGKEDK